MTAQTDTNGGHTRISVLLAIFIGVIAALVSNSLPAFLAVLSRMRGLTEAQSGFSATADLGGISLGVMVCAALPAIVLRLGWRRTVAIGLALMICANLASIVVTAFVPYLAVRLLAGIGSGIVIAIVYAILGEGDGARSLAIFNVGQLATAALCIPFFSLLADRYGIAILFGIIAVVGLLALPLTSLLPYESLREAAAEAEHSHASERISLAGWLSVASVLLMFIGVGAVYGFMSYMGTAWGIDPATVESDISKVVFGGMAGAALVAVVGSRFGYRIPMFLGFALLMATTAALMLFKPVVGFLGVSALFFFAVNVTMTYEFEAVTEIDPSSRAAMMVSAATLGGTAMGPTVAGFLVTPDFALVNAAGLATFVASLLLILIARSINARTR